MLVEEQKYLEKIIDKLRKELLTARKNHRQTQKRAANGAGGLAALLLCIDRKFTGIFCKDPDVISVACQIIHITFPFYFIYSIMELTGSVVRGLKKIFLSMVAMVYPMTWLLAMFSFLLCYRKSELFRSF